MKIIKIIISLFIVFNISQINAQEVVRYELTVTDTLVNFSGKEKRGIAVNGQIPMPTLTFTDPTFRKGIDDLPAIPIILSEWTDIKPENVQRMLRNASDWAGIKKGTVQSYSEAIAAGHFKTKVTNEWKRMLAMDVSDVYYDRFLINGKNEIQFSQFSAGQKVRLRIANGGASSYFWLTYAGGKITVVANDGNDVEPVEVDRLIVGVSETYDVVITIPENNTAYEFLVTPEDRTETASAYFGSGIIQLKSRLPKLKYFEGMKMMNDMMKMDGSMDDMGMRCPTKKWI